MKGRPRVLRPGAIEILPWVPAFVGVAIMVGVLVFAIVSLRPSDPPTPAPLEPALTAPLPAAPESPEPSGGGGATPEVTPSAVSPSPSPSPSRTAARARPPRTTAPPPAPAPPPEVTGRYRVVESFSDSFIGEVLVSNSAGDSRNWTVRLRFPANVGGLRTFWVEGAPQPALQRSGDTFVFTGGAPVPARGSVQLRFHFNRTGAISTPAACSVNGTPCS